MRGQKLNSVHFLRFVAAAAVVVHHIITSAGSQLMLGAAGVDVFFVISGVVISLALGRESALEFGTKRAVRVLPLYWIATIVFAVFRFHEYQMTPTGEDWIRSFLLLPRAGWAPIYYAGWTLCYEALFYVVATASITLFGPAARSACLAIVVALAAALNLPLLLEFCAGMLIGQLVLQDRLPRARQGLLCIALAVGLFACHPGAVGDDRMMVWGVPAALLVYGLLAFDDAKLFRTRFVKLGGDASYALYLFHLPVIEGLNAPGAVRIAAAVAVAVLIRLFVEKPILSGLHSLLRPAPAISAGDAPA
jgi:exopolysaccharide production protein ExoZ